MKYTKELLLKACAEFVPTLVEHQKAAHASIPELLRYAAVEAFMQADTVDFRLSSDKAFAAHIIKLGLEELKVKGCLEYGIKNEYWE